MFSVLAQITIIIPIFELESPNINIGDKSNDS